jgi:hypothetical protein
MARLKERVSDRETNSRWLHGRGVAQTIEFLFALQEIGLLLLPRHPERISRTGENLSSNKS